MVNRVSRLLVKSRFVPASNAFAVGPMSIRMEPLFEERPPVPGMGLVGSGLAAESRWHLAHLSGHVDQATAWDLCHQMQSGSMGLAASSVDFVEPDLQQHWNYAPLQETDELGIAAAAPPRTCGEPAQPETAAGGYSAPSPYEWRWFQHDDFAGFDTARTHIDLATLGQTVERITIAHLDTGYRQNHAVLPQFLDHTVERSFVKDDPNPNSAVDPGIEGFGNNPGHGTGTLSLLAGNIFDATPFGGPSSPVGAAPFARIIPVRVANSVVEFANSSIAQGIQYAIDQNVDVLSMSMGGIPLECPVFSVPVRNDETGIERVLRWHEARSIRQSRL